MDFATPLYDWYEDWSEDSIEKNAGYWMYLWL